MFLPSLVTRPLILAFLLGLLSVAGFSPFDIYPLVILSLAGLFLLLEGQATWRRGLLIGLAWGGGAFGAGVSWIFVSIHQFGGAPLPAAVVLTALFCLILALFPAAFGALGVRYAPGFVRRVILFPALWALLEWVRGWMLSGFPWLAVGYSQVSGSPLANWAPLSGVVGVSWLTALCAGLLVWIKTEPTQRKQAVAVFCVLWLGSALLGKVAWVSPQGAPLAVSLLQGNIPQDAKWRADRLDLSMSAYARLAASSQGKLVVLPETAIPLFHDRIPPEYLEVLTRNVRSRGGDLVLGLAEWAGKGGAYYNSAFSHGVSPTQVYRKNHLVPFGEFVPLEPVLGWVMKVMHIPMSSFSRGAAQQAPMQVAGQRVAVNICYEDVFGEEIIRALPQATLLVNLSNDAWFGRSLAPWQHLQISRMRALETGRYMLRATNTGMTAVIDERGHVRHLLPEFITTVLEGQAQGFTGTTPYVRFGNTPVVVLLVVLLAFSLRGRKR